MQRNVMPMIRVPDTRATMEWYQSIGFSVVDTNEYEGHIDWVMLTFGSGGVMFTDGGQLTDDPRREVDLYVHTDDIDALHQRLKDRVEIRKEPHDTFYGMRELIIRDPNGFWITFGEPIAS